MTNECVTLRLNATATIANACAAVLSFGWGIFYVGAHEIDWLTVAWSAVFLLGGLYGFSRLSLRLTVGPEGLVRSGRYLTARRRAWTWDDVRLVITRQTGSQVVPVKAILSCGRVDPEMAYWAGVDLAMPIIARHLPLEKIVDQSTWEASRR